MSSPSQPPSGRRTPTATPETDPRFKSARYRGHYIQDGARSPQEMTLAFADGRIAGFGADPVGEFVVSGTYETERGRATLVKRYPGRHSVHYDATAEVHNGIWGLWVIHGPWGARGGFQLWPIEGPGQGIRRKLEADRPIRIENGVGDLAGAVG